MRLATGRAKWREREGWGRRRTRRSARTWVDLFCALDQGYHRDRSIHI